MREMGQANFVPYEAPAREIAKSILQARIPSNFPEEFRLLLGEVLVEGIHDGIEFAQSMDDPIIGTPKQGEIYLKGYFDGHDDAVNGRTSDYEEGEK